MMPSTDSKSDNLTEISTEEELEQMKKSTTDKGIVVLCCANWYEPCTVLKDTVIKEMIKLYKNLTFCWIDCDKLVNLMEKYEVEIAPTVLIFHPLKQDVDKYVNPSPDVLNKEIAKHDEYYKTIMNAEKERAFQDIEVIISSYPLVVFIKGTPEEPRCKFTRRLLAHLNKFELKFKSFNILEDERIRQWLKIYSNWPTYPQVFINKQFVGGIDIIDQLVEENEFIEMVPKECKKLPPIETFEEMLSSFDLVVLLEGTPESPSTDSSKSIIEILNSNSIKYVTVNYSLLNDEVKSHIKNKYNVSEVPYIFVKKEGFGNQETLMKCISEGSLESSIPETCREMSLNDRLKKLINSKPIMVFMKGTPQQPECGFSSQLISIMSEYDYEYGYFNIFTDDEVRQGLKEYSKWPTYPQVYVKGSLIGGLDIIKELHQEKELEDELKKSLS